MWVLKDKKTNVSCKILPHFSPSLHSLLVDVDHHIQTNDLVGNASAKELNQLTGRVEDNVL